MLELLRPGFELPRQARRLVKALFWCQALAIMWFALFGGEEQTRLQRLLGLDDYAMHILAFLAVSATAFLLWAPLSLVAILLGLGAASIELAQALVPGRHPSLFDFTASALGILAGAAAVRHIWPRLARRLFSGSIGGVAGSRAGPPAAAAPDRKRR